MARTVDIVSTKDSFLLLLDGKEMKDVLEYSVSEDSARSKVLTVKIAVTDSVNLEVKN